MVAESNPGCILDTEVCVVLLALCELLKLRVIRHLTILVSISSSRREGSSRLICGWNEFISIHFLLLNDQKVVITDISVRFLIILIQNFNIFLLEGPNHRNLIIPIRKL